uniref:Uncharacterized protein n=1 Tax=Anguilla anguilla TaxID=7936 RepID=A0A0E9UIS4_ANGAN
MITQISVGMRTVCVLDVTTLHVWKHKILS